MKKISLIILVTLFSTSIFAAPSKIIKSGDCKLYEAGLSDKEKIFTLDLKNEDIQAVCQFRGKVSSSNKFRLVGVPKITNLSEVKVDVSYNVAFFDEAGNLTASIYQNATLKPNAKNPTQLASALAYLPKSEFEKISSYKLVIYIEEASEE